MGQLHRSDSEHPEEDFRPETGWGLAFQLPRRGSRSMSCDARGRLMRTRGRLEVCVLIALLLGACAQDPNVKKQQYLERGLAYQKEGKYNEAIIQLKNALQIDPKFAPALHAIGRAYRAKSWSVDALRELHRAVELEPDNVAARVDLGQVYLDLEGWSAAIEQADAIRVRAQDSPGELYIRGVALNGLGNHAQAVPFLARALRLGAPTP